MYDLGCCTGKVALQAFLQFPNLKRVWRVEISLRSVPRRGTSTTSFSSSYHRDYHVDAAEPGSSIEVTSNDRTLIIEHGNLMRTRDVGETRASSCSRTEAPAYNV